MAEVSHVSPIGRPEVGCRVNKTFPKIKNQDHFRHRCCAISCRTKGQKPRQDCFDVLRSVIYLLSAVSHSSSQGFHMPLGCFLLYLSALQLFCPCNNQKPCKTKPEPHLFLLLHTTRPPCPAAKHHGLWQDSSFADVLFRPHVSACNLFFLLICFMAFCILRSLRTTLSSSEMSSSISTPPG